MLRTILLLLAYTGSVAGLAAQNQSHPALQKLPTADSVEAWLSTPLMQWGLGALICLAVLGWFAFIVCSIPLCKDALRKKFRKAQDTSHPGLYARYTTPRVSLDHDGLEGFFPQLQAADHKLAPDEGVTSAGEPGR